MPYAFFRPESLVGLIAAFLLVVSSALAENRGTDTAITLEKDLRNYVINEDGSFIADHELVVLINEERGIRGYSQRALNYNRTLESLEIIEAYTQKADGRKVPVKPDQIKEQQERESSNAPMFQDTLVKVVIFPEVAIGDRLVLRYKTHRTTALFPRHFESLTYPAFHPIDQFTLTYNLPQNMPLYADVRGFKATEPVVAAGRKIYRWDNIPAPKDRIESGAVSYQDYGQYLAVSTFPDFKAFAQAYDARAKSRVTGQVSQLAKTITADLASPRDKAIALNDWMRKNIRYVAVYVGPGGVVPHSVETILANRYGDCKDHVALLEALLVAVGIDSTPVLLNAANAYTLPKVPTLGVLNHAMIYIPGLDLFLDSTAQAIAGGYLPVYNLDKPVLFSKSGTLGRTPATQEGKVESNTLFKVKPNGSVDFTHSYKVTGWAAEPNRYSIDSIAPADRKQLVQKILASYGQTGKGELKVDQLDTRKNEFSMSMYGQSENMISFPGPTGVPTMSSITGGIAQTVFAFAAESDRVQAFTCISGVTEEQARFEFAKEVNIVAIPKSTTIQHQKFEYSSTYSKDLNVVVVRRFLDFKHPGAVCTAEDFKNMRTAIDLMMSDLKSQIVVQRK